MQQLALLSLTLHEAMEKDKEEETRFRGQIIAYHLGDAKRILDIIDGAQREEAGLAPELSEDQMEEYEPLSTEEADAAIAMLRNFGVAVQ